MRRPPAGPTYLITKVSAEAVKANASVKKYMHAKSSDVWHAQNNHLVDKRKRVMLEIACKNPKGDAAGTASGANSTAMRIETREDDPNGLPIEDVSQVSALSVSQKNDKDATEKSEVSEFSLEEVQNRYFQDDATKFCRRCKQRGHVGQTCRMKGSGNCYFCLGEHTRINCPEGRICFSCGGANHSRNDCPASLKHKCSRCYRSHETNERCRILLTGDDQVRRDLSKVVDMMSCLTCGKGGHVNCRKRMDEPSLFGERLSEMIMLVKEAEEGTDLEALVQSHQAKHGPLHVPPIVDSLLRRREEMSTDKPKGRPEPERQRRDNRHLGDEVGEIFDRRHNKNHGRMPSDKFRNSRDNQDDTGDHHHHNDWSNSRQGNNGNPHRGHDQSSDWHQDNLRGRNDSRRHNDRNQGNKRRKHH